VYISNWSIRVNNEKLDMKQYNWYKACDATLCGVFGHSKAKKGMEFAGGL
jgi:hypothetical protein